MRNIILVADEEEKNRERVKRVFENSYTIISVPTGKEAIIQMGNNFGDVALMIVSLSLPDMNGLQMMTVLKTKGLLDKIPVILTGYGIDEDMRTAGYRFGAQSVMQKPFSDMLLKVKVETITKVYNNVEKLEEELIFSKKRLENVSEKMIDVVSNLAEFRNVESKNHTKRVKEYTRIIAKKYQELFPNDGLTDEMLVNIVMAATVHDIGKIAVSDAILLKPTKLTEDEHEVLKSHTTKGEEIVSSFVGMHTDEQIKCMMQVCRSHHEREDGSGFPDGLSGDEIPLAARIVGVADMYDTLVSERIYKKAYDKKTAFNMLMSGECGAFSIKVLKCFSAARNQIEEIE